MFDAASPGRVDRDEAAGHRVAVAGRVDRLGDDDPVVGGVDAERGVLPGTGGRHGLRREQDRAAAVEVDDRCQPGIERHPAAARPCGPPRRPGRPPGSCPGSGPAAPYSGSVSAADLEVDACPDRGGRADRRRHPRSSTGTTARRGGSAPRAGSPSRPACPRRRCRRRRAGRPGGDRGRRAPGRSPRPGSGATASHSARSSQASRASRLRPRGGELRGRRRRWRRRPCPCARRRRTGSPRRCWPTASRARAPARARRPGRSASDRMAEPWQRMLSASGGFSIAWTGAISPRTVRAISSAQVSARSRQSTCGLVCQASVTVAGAICAGEMLPWVSTHDPDRDPRPDRRADPADHLGVGVRMLLADRRPVLRHEDAVERALGLERGGDVAPHLLERLAVDRAARRGRGEDQRHDLDARRGCRRHGSRPSSSSPRRGRSTAGRR